MTELDGFSDAELLSLLKTVMRLRRRQRRRCAELQAALDKIVRAERAAGMRNPDYWSTVWSVLAAAAESRALRSYARGLQEEWLRRKARRQDGE